MKINFLNVGFIVCFFTACTLNLEPDSKKVKALNNTDFLGGGITIIYDDEGDFKSITSVATSRVTSKLPSAVEEAFKIATLKARRQIAEFISVEVNSDQFTNSISDSLQASGKNNKNTRKELRNSIALKVQESITQKSNQILRGTFVQSEKHDSEKDIVKVVVVTGVETIGTSNILKKIFE